MNIYKLVDDVIQTQSLSLDVEDFLDLLDPHIGESQAMLLGQQNIAIESFWEPLELNLYPNEGAVHPADISTWRSGLMLMNQKAYDALSDLLNPYGEFLPCSLHDSPAYFFNCLNLKSPEDAHIKYRMHNDIYAEVESIEFDTSDTIFKHENKVSFEIYVSEQFVEAASKANLRGLTFKTNFGF